MSLGKSSLSVMHCALSCWPYEKGRGFQQVVTPASKDVVSSKSRLVASSLRLSKTAGVDVLSPLITSSHVVAASERPGWACCSAVDSQTWHLSGWTLKISKYAVSECMPCIEAWGQQAVLLPHSAHMSDTNQSNISGSLLAN